MSRLYQTQTAFQILLTTGLAYHCWLATTARSLLPREYLPFLLNNAGMFGEWASGVEDAMTRRNPANARFDDAGVRQRWRSELDSTLLTSINSFAYRDKTPICLSSYSPLWAYIDDERVSSRDISCADDVGTHGRPARSVLYATSWNCAGRMERSKTCRVVGRPN
ncbi:hypothetical protein SCHPADRAFT_1003469 [Schizopora paradoxa]|uniref:Uncharacterized protein n=1 Tax=Schizopora paradoxa TaxID=27342 RepID=A0A0H2RFV4_9AGAM|nr:hypothetical protein SCHPADRAFT_1003469 [Schizopora paradoxa]